MWTPPIIRLLRHQRIEAERVRDVLIQKRYDTEVWCHELGFDLRKVSSDFLVEPVVAMLRGSRIYVLKGLLKNEEIEAIAHEYAHHTLHANCISYLDLNIYTAGHDEGQAIEFARIVVADY